MNIALLNLIIITYNLIRTNLFPKKFYNIYAINAFHSLLKLHRWLKPHLYLAYNRKLTGRHLIFILTNNCYKHTVNNAVVECVFTYA